MISQAQSIDSVATQSQHRHTLDDGSVVVVANDAVAIHDEAGRLLVRFRDGHAEISAPAGDLKLNAPNGRVVVEAQDEVHIKAPRTTLVSDEARVFAGRIHTTAQSIQQRVGRLEVIATRLLETTEQTFRKTSGLVQTQAGRMRTVVDAGYNLLSKRTSLLSKRETTIDGDKILLG